MAESQVTAGHVIWGTALPHGTSVTLLPGAPFGEKDGGAGPRVGYAAVSSAPALSLTPDMLVVHVPEKTDHDGATMAVAATLAQYALVMGFGNVSTLWQALVRLHRDRTWVDVRDAVLATTDYRRVLHTELFGSCQGAGTQCVAMCLRPSDGDQDPDGAAVEREVHTDLAQLLIPVAGTARATVELVELGRKVELDTSRPMVVRVPPGITHLIRVTGDKGSVLNLLSIYTSAEHPWDRVQPTRPTSETAGKPRVTVTDVDTPAYSSS